MQIAEGEWNTLDGVCRCHKGICGQKSRSTTFLPQAGRCFQPGLCQTSTSTVPVLWWKACTCRPFVLRSETVQYNIEFTYEKGERDKGGRQRFSRVDWVLDLSPYEHQCSSPDWDNMRNALVKSQVVTFQWLMDAFHNLMEFSLLSSFEF